MSTLFVWLLILGLAGALIWYTYSPGLGSDVSTSPGELEYWLAKTPQDFKTAYIKDEMVYAELAGHAVDKGRPSKFEIRIRGEQMLDRWDKLLQDKLPPPKDKTDKEKGYQGIQKSVPWEAFLFQWILPAMLIMGLCYFLFFRQLRQSGMGGGVLNFGRTRARLMRRENSKTTFADVAGMIEAKEEVLEIIEFLRNPKKFQRLGGRIPRGVLFIGPPGTGKTLLAKAIAGEAEVPFFSISGSDFVEMFVGVGASRVRDLFRQAKESSPCIIFLDEIDAVGRKRGAGFTGAHDEREQTLNAILVEMDGFETNDQVIIIAATNRPDVLDPALRRPGRFDREVMIGLPDIKERESILKVHARNVKIAPDVNLSIVARGTPGFSGADLSALINEAALAATMHAKDAVDLSDLEEARDKVRWGRSRRSKVMDDMDKNITAYHEAGHTLLTVLLQPDAEPLHKVTIIPRGQALGSTMFLPEKDRYTIRRRECLANIKVGFGGRIAEEMVFQDISSGAAQDIRSASELVRRMIKEWGMSDSMGPIYYPSGSESEEGFGSEMFGVREYSEDTAREIDEEIKRTLDDCYRQASELLTHHRDMLDRLAKALLAFESLDAEEVQQIMAGGTITRAGNGAADVSAAAVTEAAPFVPPQA
jgi:cell division protease FtsH